MFKEEGKCGLQCFFRVHGRKEGGRGREGMRGEKQRGVKQRQEWIERKED